MFPSLLGHTRCSHPEVSPSPKHEPLLHAPSARTSFSSRSPAALRRPQVRARPRAASARAASQATRRRLLLFSSRSPLSAGTQLASPPFEAQQGWEVVNPSIIIKTIVGDPPEENDLIHH